VLAARASGRKTKLQSKGSIWGRIRSESRHEVTDEFGSPGTFITPWAFLFAGSGSPSIRCGPTWMRLRLENGT
jgi:hypothetical protein